MNRRIHIMGASGAGTTTLGKALAARLPHVHLDSDDYFWEQKYSIQTPVAARLSRLRTDLEQQNRGFCPVQSADGETGCAIRLIW